MKSAFKVFITLITLFLILYFLYPPIDGIKGELLALLLGENTVYSKNYSDNAFRKITIGMTKEEVEQLLGEPLFIGKFPESSLEIWDYSEQIGSGDNFRRREFSLVEGKVESINAHFYVD